MGFILPKSFIHSSKLYTVYDIPAVREGWMIIVVDTMKQTAEH